MKKGINDRKCLTLFIVNCPYLWGFVKCTVDTFIAPSQSYIALEYDLSLGRSIVNISNFDEVIIYKGSYSENLIKINNNYLHPDYTFSNITSLNDLRDVLGKTEGIYTIISKVYTGSQNKENIGLIGIPYFDLIGLGVKDISYIMSNSSVEDNVSNWNTSNVETMISVFEKARKFNGNINNWNVSKVKNMSYMFDGTNLFNQPLNNWDVSNVKSFKGMFHDALVFNQNINSWNTSKAEDLSVMFNHASLFNQPLNNWDVSKVTTMWYMFRNAPLFNQDISNWDVSQVENMENMFYSAKSFNQNLSSWNVTKIPNEPIGFSTYTTKWNESKPIWGTNGGN